MYSLHTDFGSWDNVQLDRSFYIVGNRVALSLLTSEGEPLCRLSVNLVNEAISNEDCFFVDTNNAPFAEKFILDNNIAKPTGKMGHSGYCLYPEYQLIIN